ncbi:MAG: hypothetical protein IKK72_01950 [Oscillospiraceae bacterium]|nr:hypothetical protein [Oscillospiraceae bacterium]
MKTNSKQMAMGGVFAALAVVIMNLGGLIPVATYTTPVICMLLLKFVLLSCGRRIAWAWYVAVAILGLLMSPDKESAAVFAFLGYYPILKPKLEQMKGKWLWKLAVFNVSMVLLYSILIRVMGVAAVTGESEGLGKTLLIVLLILGNVTFIALDRMLTLLEIRLRRKK